MKFFLSRSLSITILSITVSACATNFSTDSTSSSAQTTASNGIGTETLNIQVSNRILSSNEPLGGNLEQYMDVNDKQKLSRGLDNALGKATTWTSPLNGREFTVTPLRKVTLSSSKFCRTYSVRMERKTEAEQVSGTACIGEDGSWHVV